MRVLVMHLMEYDTVMLSVLTSMQPLETLNSTVCFYILRYEG